MRIGHAVFSDHVAITTVGWKITKVIDTNINLDRQVSVFGCLSLLFSPKLSKGFAYVRLTNGNIREAEVHWEDYLYPASYFISIKLSRKAQEALVATS